MKSPRTREALAKARTRTAVPAVQGKCMVVFLKGETSNQYGSTEDSAQFSLTLLVEATWPLPQPPRFKQVEVEVCEWRRRTRQVLRSVWKSPDPMKMANQPERGPGTSDVAPIATT